MLIFKKVDQLQDYLQTQGKNGLSIGFVPTMGALHQGHISLIDQANAANDISVCSIFVNPTQFNDKSDLAKYPRPIEHDIELLVEANCDVLFLPEVSEIYPPDFDYDYELDLGYITQPMEGAFRPGHFKGVIQVVKRLLDIVQPSHLYMGQKDFQQFSIIKAMIKKLAMPVQIVMCPILREPDGLAMSSRNVRLSPDGRQLSSQISAALRQAQADAKALPLAQVLENARLSLQKAGIEIEYLEAVHADTLQPATNFDDAESVVLCTTVRIDGVRLLDNVVLK
jgi:pantoate--beta-alanine ligase